MQIIFHFLFSIYFNLLIYTQLSTLSLPLHVLNHEVSSQGNYDKVSFYKNGTELKIDLSGTEYGSTELNELIISDIIKVVYKKDSSTDSNKDIVSFSVGIPTRKIITNCDNTGSGVYINSTEIAFDLDYPVGLLTHKESWLANSDLTTNYLDNGFKFWLMSPSNIIAKVYVASYLASIENGISVGAVHRTNNIRPAITLKQNILIAGGTGKIEDPYTVALPN